MSTGRSSGNVIRKNTPKPRDPLTCAASSISELMLANPELTNRYTKAVSPKPVMMMIHGIV